MFTLIFVISSGKAYLDIYKNLLFVNIFPQTSSWSVHWRSPCFAQEELGSIYLCCTLYGCISWSWGVQGDLIGRNCFTSSVALDSCTRETGDCSRCYRCLLICQRIKFKPGVSYEVADFTFTFFDVVLSSGWCMCVCVFWGRTSHPAF